MKYNINEIVKGLWCAASVMMLGSCSMINEDLAECAPPPDTYTTVNFVYDYNMQYTDLFDQHAGSVSLYVFDEDGVMLFRETKSKVEMPNNEVDFSMTFDDKTIVPGHTYNFVAMANGNHGGYDSMVEDTPGFQIEPSVEMVPGKSRIEDFIIKLDRNDDGNYDFGIVNYKDAYGNNTDMIDTVWSTKPDEVQTVHIPYVEYKPTATPLPDRKVEVTIPMMRLTNAVTVNLLANGFTENTNTEAYHVLVYFPHGNGTIDFTGTTYEAQPLYYQTLRKNMVVYTPLSQQASGNQSNKPGLFKNPTRADGFQYALQSEFGVSRLQMNDESSLQVRDSKTDELIAEIPDFSKFLANAFDYYGENGQEFLDREYEFEITLALQDPGIDNPGGDDPDPGPGDNPGGDDPDPGPGDNPGGDDPDPGPGDNPGGDDPDPGPGGDPDPGPGIDDPTDNWLYIDIYVKTVNWVVRINNIKM